MSSHEVGPEWVVSSLVTRNPIAQAQISELLEVARRIWPRVQSHAIKEQPRKSPDEAIGLASEVWESALQSIGKTIVRSSGALSIRDFDAYLFGVFVHRLNRALRRERRRREIVQYFPSTHELETLRQANDSKAAREIERSAQVKEFIQRMDEWTRKVWVARKYGYSWHEIAVFFGITDAQAS
jgi:DNA-directed RNA polymerase specialized sigma24 family protein